jgi:hypothetical protein
MKKHPADSHRRPARKEEDRLRVHEPGRHPRRHPCGRIHMGRSECDPSLSPSTPFSPAAAKALNALSVRSTWMTHFLFSKMQKGPHPSAPAETSPDLCLFVRLMTLGREACCLLAFPAQNDDPSALALNAEAVPEQATQGPAQRMASPQEATAGGCAADHACAGDFQPQFIRIAGKRDGNDIRTTGDGDIVAHPLRPPFCYNLLSVDASPNGTERDKTEKRLSADMTESLLRFGGSAWESNPPSRVHRPHMVLKTRRDTSTPSTPICMCLYGTSTNFIITHIPYSSTPQSSKGISTREIQDHLENLYGIEVSPTLISNVTTKILPLIQEWQDREGKVGREYGGKWSYAKKHRPTLERCLSLTAPYTRHQLQLQSP